MTTLSGKVALVTGGTSGIGKASAILFAKEGAKVAFTGRRTAEGEAVAHEIIASGGDAIFIQSDLKDIESIDGMVDKVVSHYGRLDCAFNNAGISKGGLIETLDEAIWDEVVDVNLKAQFFCLSAQAKHMKKQGSGSIVFTGSVLADICFPGTSIYSASKGGIVSLTRAAAVELGPFGIRVNSFSPSITKTEMTASKRTADPDGKETHPYAINIPLRRLAEPNEMAEVALFLLSDRSSYVNGQSIIVDGGQSLT